MLMYSLGCSGIILLPDILIIQKLRIFPKDEDTSQNPLVHPEEEEGKRPLYERMANDFMLSREEVQVIFNDFSAKEIYKILYAVNLDFRDKNVQNKKAYTLNRFKMEKK